MYLVSTSPLAPSEYTSYPAMSEEQPVLGTEERNIEVKMSLGSSLVK